MNDPIATTVQFIAHHAEWTFPIMFVTAFGESFVFLSLLFPGTTIMIAAGLLVPGGTVPLVPLLVGAILGAVLGDAISYWLGRRFGPYLTKKWPFTRYPGLLDASETSFKRYGALSVFIGRFFGPLRATIPLVAGMMKMPPLQFWIANVASALVWAPALLMPGTLAVLFSDSLGAGRTYRPFIIVAAIVLVIGLAWLARRSRWLRRVSGDTE